MNLCPDYRNFSFSKINTKEFSHTKLLLYWIVYGIFFLYVERIRVCEYYVVESVLDSYIPFCSAFIVPYFFWFVYLIGMLVYTFFKDVTAFKKYMWYIIFTYSFAMIVYLVFPTCQQLRPVVLGKGFFDKIVSGLYVFDTNTNVCPSIHVLGTLAVLFAGLNCESMKKTLVKVFLILAAVLIILSTVFLKQHSVIDMFSGLVVGFVFYPLVFCKNKLLEFLMRIC